MTDMPPAAYGARPTPLYLDAGVADAGVLEKLETQLRLAKDKLGTKSEKVAELEEYKGNLEREMDEFTVTLFEEAHEMVRVEKEARHKDHMLLLLQETQDKSSVLQEELKALKALVEHMQKASGKGGKAKAYLTPVEAAAAKAQAEDSAKETRTYDTQLFNELLRRHAEPALEAQGSDFMKRVMSDDVNPCLAFHPKTAALSEKLLTAIVANMLVIEMAPAPADKDVVCALTLGKVVGE